MKHFHYQIETEWKELIGIHPLFRFVQHRVNAFSYYYVFWEIYFIVIDWFARNGQYKMSEDLWYVLQNVILLP
jgi:hypothetical protein